MEMENYMENFYLLLNVYMILENDYFVVVNRRSYFICMDYLGCYRHNTTEC